jgi:hypothetical protein
VFNLRLATSDDVPELQALIAASARGLSVGFYSPEQIEAAVAHVFGVDTQLISDGTYYVIDESGAAVATGGWSGRRTLYGGDQMKSDVDPRLDPASEPARIRAFANSSYCRLGLVNLCTRAWLLGHRARYSRLARQRPD